MAHDWENPAEVMRWDVDGNLTNPIRPEQLDILVSILVSTMQPGKWILDLGYGSGQVEQLIFNRVANASVVGVDNSAEMMKLARERLADHLAQFESIQFDLANLPTLNLPHHPYQMVLAIQSLHHLSVKEMQAAYHWIFDVLQPGGVFLLLDRIRVETDGLWKVMQQVWERQDHKYDADVVRKEGESFSDHERIVRERGDFPVLLDEHLKWLREAGFEAACLHLHGNRALIVGRKS